MEFLNEGYIGVIIGVIGIILSVYFYRKSLNRPRPAYQMASMRVIEEVSDSNGNIEIMFNGSKVDRVVKTQVAFWNAGSNTINSHDIVERDPIIIMYSEDSKILNYNIISISRSVNLFRAIINENSNQVEVTFDFLDPSDGAIIEIIHNDNKLFPRVTGTIKGNMKGITDYGKLAYPLLNRGKRKIGSDFYAASSIMMMSIYLGLMYFFPDEIRSNPNTSAVILIISLFGVLTCLMLLIFGLIRRRKFPERRFKPLNSTKINDEAN
ncbi:hypothetical protein D3P09_03260 [Paenibacillus pinisoli]|uniref:Uncharacterized protein n=1 Tax=Paenibacillus pinisoli TaxID=1276110 RepID=A0A3A6Q5A6_9BACL|nr:hypothetical protein [Paenibacillus pinisoli]RJX41044.1 hypothetical protein D3P09_03260 [Paenibacillus pinisoli]